MAATRSDEGQRQCCLDNVSGNSLRSDERSTVIVPKIAAVERRKARVPSQGYAGRLRKGVPVVLAPFRRSASLREATKDRARSPETGQDGLTIRRHGPRGAGSARPFDRNGAT